MESGVKKLAILGAGLLGGSIAKAVKKFDVKFDGAKLLVSVWSRSPQTLRKCEMLSGVFDEVCQSPSAAVLDADLVIICVPTANIAPLLTEIAPYLKKSALVSDVGSVKAKVCADCKSALATFDAHFIGSHPMAGSEKIGVDFSDENLFKNRVCIVTPSENDLQMYTQKLEKFWRDLGMKVEIVSPQKHDRLVALISHAPHLIAGTLCRSVNEAEGDFALRFAGPGFRDCTRVVSGSPDIWDSICADNKDEIVLALKLFQSKLDQLVADLTKSDAAALSKALRDAKSFRDKLI